MYYIGEAEIKALRKLFATKRLYRYQGDRPGECVRFETEFARRTGTDYALLLTSGTNALLVALLASGVQPGDEVLLPAYTFVATASAVVQAGAIPVLVNIDTKLGICAKDAATKITKRTKAIIPVHMDGLAADMNAILKLAKKYKLIVIEDAAQAIGGSYKKKKLGSMGLFGCYSLNENKLISCGEGGIVVSSDRTLFEKAFCLHDTPAQFNPTMQNFFTKITPFLGASMRVSEIQGSIMRVQLSRIEKILRELRKRKAIFIGELAELGSVKTVSGHCADGDCATSLHLQFEDPQQALRLGQKIRAQGLSFMPVTARPAHASWKWSHLLGERAHIQKASNPFLASPKDYDYSNAAIMDSISILMRTLKMDIRMDLNTKATLAAAKKLRRTLSG